MVELPAAEMTFVINGFTDVEARETTAVAGTVVFSPAPFRAESSLFAGAMLIITAAATVAGLFRSVPVICGGLYARSGKNDFSGARCTILCHSLIRELYARGHIPKTQNCIFRSGERNSTALLDSEELNRSKRARMHVKKLAIDSYSL